MQIHQFHGVAAYGDAIGNHILSLQTIIRKLGYTSEIFAEFAHPDFEARARQFGDYQPFSSPANVLLCHFSIGYSPEVLAWLQRLPDRKILIYHNITPSHYFHGVNDIFCQATRDGRSQLPLLETLTVAGWGDSDFNREELVRNGWTRTAVLPIVFEPEMYSEIPDPHVSRRFGIDDSLNVLFVSRLAPNKKFEDLVLVFYYLKRFIEPKARLLLVGSTDHMGPYLAYLQALIERLRLTDVVVTGRVSRGELVAYYRAADVYLCLSEHEGFGVPLVESMYFDVPVIAYAAAAVPETLGGAGVLITRKEHAAIAELVHIVARDEGLRSRIVQQQQQRWRAFTPEAVGPVLLDCLRQVGCEP
jgi:L-malate glycosyltransferase